jgi:hypothetical protein
VVVATSQILATVRFAQSFQLLIVVRFPSVLILVVRVFKYVKQKSVVAEKTREPPLLNMSKED